MSVFGKLMRASAAGAFLSAAAGCGTTGVPAVVPIPLPGAALLIIPPSSATASTETFQRCAAAAITQHTGSGTPQMTDRTVEQNGWRVTRLDRGGLQTFTPNVRDSELENARRTAGLINNTALRCM